MPITKSPKSKMPEKSLSQESAVDESAPPEVLPRSSSSSLTELYRRPEFSLSWDNDIKHHIASNLLHLRRYRDKSQTDVAEAIGTSQPAIAKIEAGDSNFTADTVERIVGYLRGRFFVRIQPEEFGFQRRTPWWEGKLKAQTDWSLSFALFQEATPHDNTERLLIGMQRTTPRNNVFISHGHT